MAKPVALTRYAESAVTMVLMRPFVIFTRDLLERRLPVNLLYDQTLSIKRTDMLFREITSMTCDQSVPGLRERTAERALIPTMAAICWAYANTRFDENINAPTITARPIP